MAEESTKAARDGELAAPLARTAWGADDLLAALTSFRAESDRLSWLVGRVQTLPPPPAALRQPSHLVPGCLSRLWLTAEYRAGRCSFHADSDSLIVRAIADAICTYCSDRPAREVPAALEAISHALHLRRLTANRRNTLSRIQETVRRFAVGCADSPVDHAAKPAV